MDKKLRNCGIYILISFAVKSIIEFIGKSSLNDEQKPLFWGNEAFADLGDQFFRVACFLIAFYIVGAIILRFLRELVKNVESFPRMRNFRQDLENKESGTEMTRAYLDYLMNLEAVGRVQGNYFFLISIIALLAGIALIGGGAAYANIKIGNQVSALLFFSGIVSEIVSICFGFMYNKLLKQITSVHELIGKKEQFYVLMEMAEKVGNKEEFVMKILENDLWD